MVPSEGVRAGVLVADETEGGGVGLLRRPPVRERKAVKRAWVEERRSGAAWSNGGEMRLGVARGARLVVGERGGGECGPWAGGTAGDYCSKGQRQRRGL